MSIDFNKYVRPMRGDFRAPSYAGLIRPKYVLRIGDFGAYLPNDHADFIAALNAAQPQTPGDILKIEMMFARKRKG